MTSESRPLRTGDLPGGSGQGKTPETAVAGFLRAFRRRKIAAALLKLSFLAAILNETYRWSAAILSTWMKDVLPIMHVGHFFLLALFIGLLRKWTPPLTASRADAHFAFQDRFTSFVDFAGRSDIPDALKRAQAKESAAALEGLSPRRRPRIPVLLFAGPLLLLVSMTYPMLAVTSLKDFIVRSPLVHVGIGRAPGDRSGGGTSSRTAPDIHEGSKPEERITSSSEEVPEDGAVDSFDDQESDNQAGDTGGAPGKETVATDEESTRTSGPKTSGSSPLRGEPRREREKSARVMDPVYSPPQQRKKEKRRQLNGSMTYRLMPGRRGAGRGVQPAEGERGRSEEVVVDYESIPARYRRVVENYFRLLSSSDNKEEMTSLDE